MIHIPYKLAEDPRPCLGLIALQVDETIEDDFRRMFPVGITRLHISRVPSGAALTPRTIAKMAEDLPGAAALLPPAAQFDTVAYGCTSGTTLISETRVRSLIRGAVETQSVTNPFTAALAAMHALGLKRIGIVSPYIASVSQPLADAFETHGLEVSQMVAFGEEIEARVARIAPSSIEAAALELATRAQQQDPDHGLDGIFLSCTNLRTLDVIAPLEKHLRRPVLSSNQVLAWHMAHLSEVSTAHIPGCLSEASL